MTPETPPPSERDPRPEPWRPRSDPPFGPEAAASVERSLAQIRDPDDALRILSGVEQNGQPSPPICSSPTPTSPRATSPTPSTTATSTLGNASTSSAPTSSKDSAGSTP